MACLLKELGLEPQHLMAIGDGENDVEMLQARTLAPLHWSGALKLRQLLFTMSLNIILTPL